MKTDLKKFNNSWYWKNYNNSSILRRLLWIIISNIFINSYLPLPFSVKRIILKLFGAKLGKGLIIKPKVNIKYPWLLEIGDDCWIGEHVWIDNLAKVEIGSHVCISQGAMLLTGNHDYKKPTFDLLIGEIILENGVWLGARSMVCPNVICYDHSVLAVGSIATKNLESYGIYKGNPAQLMKKRSITI